MFGPTPAPPASKPFAVSSASLVSIPGGVPAIRPRQLPAQVARALRLFASVRPSEVVALLLLTANVMLLLGSYYLLKTAREPLILQGGGAAVKTYAAAAQALLLIPVAHLFGVLAGRMTRLRLMAAVTGFFVSNLLVFWGLQRAGVAIGVPFYIWVGVFNMAVIAQFWTYVSDIYTVEQGRRLLAVIGVGAALGGLVGARVAKRVYAVVGVGGLFLIAASVLLLSLGLTVLADRRLRGPRLVTTADAPGTDAPLPQGKSGLQLLLGDRYLQLIAGLVILLNLVNTTGEFIMDRSLVEQARAQTAVPVGVFIASFKADFFSWVNGVGLVLQLLVVSRVMKYLGVGVGLYILPLVVLGGYGTLVIAPVLSLVFLTKVAENGLDYSLQSTLRQALYLPTSRAAKYRAKPLIDTFLVRGGDVLASLLVLVGQWLAFTTGTFALVNVGLALVWLVVARRLATRHGQLSNPGAAAPAATPVRNPKLAAAAA